MEEIKTGVLFFVGCLILFLFYISGLPTEDSASPQITIEYSPSIDRYLCTSFGKKKITPNWGKEMARKFPRFEFAWHNLGPHLLAKVSELTGRRFMFNEKTAHLFMCPALTSFPLPLMIPITDYVQEQNARINESQLVDSIFHEILHLFVIGVRFPNYYTAKISLHFHENWTTLTHLHLFALQKAAYLNTNQQFLWFQLKDRTKEPDLKRAIEIVETEGVQPFIDELK